jgi:hypothetical protein
MKPVSLSAVVKSEHTENRGQDEQFDGGQTDDAVPTSLDSTMAAENALVPE